MAAVAPSIFWPLRYHWYEVPPETLSVRVLPGHSVAVAGVMVPVGAVPALTTVCTRPFASLVAVAVIANMPQLSPQARLFVVTGFLGGLTTFSTFSAEVVTQLQQGHTAWALTTALAHLFGSFALTALGIATVAWLRA